MLNLARMMGRRKTFLNSRKNPQIVSVRFIHLKKTKKIDSFIWGKVLNYGVMGEALCLPGAKQNKDK